MANMNMEDPSVQEKVRRGHHDYIPTAGKHGAYVPTQYDRTKNEYPKMMGTDPQPQLKDFQKVKGVAIPGDIALANWQNAVTEWDRYMSSSIVHNAEEEAQWKRENAA